MSRAAEAKGLERVGGSEALLRVCDEDMPHSESNVFLLFDEDMPHSESDVFLHG